MLLQPARLGAGAEQKDPGQMCCKRWVLEELLRSQLSFSFYFGSRGQPVHVSMPSPSLCRGPMPSISLGGDNFGACQDSLGLSGCAELRAWAVGAGFWGACGISLSPAGFGELRVSSACWLLSLGQEDALGRMLQA